MIPDVNHGKLKGIVKSTFNLSGEINRGAAVGGGNILTKTTAEWNAMAQLQSKKNTLYVYSDYKQETDPVTGEVTNIAGGKFGDGSTYLIDLPFSITPLTQTDIDRWNDHVGVTVDETTGLMLFYH